MTVKAIIPEPLTQEAFKPFGDVIEVSETAHHFTINDGFTERYHDLAQVDVNAKDGQTGMSIFRSTPLDLPIALKMMERHPLSSQAFMPLGQQSYLVVVAEKGEWNAKQLNEKLKVFIATSAQGVNYHAGTWHHYCLALNQPSDFLVVDRIGAGDNCDVIELDGSIMIKR